MPQFSNLHVGEGNFMFFIKVGAQINKIGQVEHSAGCGDWEHLFTVCG